MRRQILLLLFGLGIAVVAMESHGLANERRNVGETIQDAFEGGIQHTYGKDSADAIAVTEDSPQGVEEFYNVIKKGAGLIQNFSCLFPGINPGRERSTRHIHYCAYEKL